MPQRNWLITGVSGGFGHIMTEQLLARDDRIAGTVRDLVGHGRPEGQVWRAAGTRRSSIPNADGRTT